MTDNQKERQSYWTAVLFCIDAGLSGVFAAQLPAYRHTGGGQSQRAAPHQRLKSIAGLRSSGPCAAAAAAVPSALLDGAALGEETNAHSTAAATAGAAGAAAADEGGGQTTAAATAAGARDNRYLRYARINSFADPVSPNGMIAVAAVAASGCQTAAAF